MTNFKKRISLLVCLVLSFIIIFVLLSCDNGAIPVNSRVDSNDFGTNTDMSTDSSTDSGEVDKPNLPTQCIIEKAEGFSFDEAGTTPKIYKIVSNTTDVIDLSKSISVTEGCSWRMYKDFSGEEEFKLKSMSLSVGENKAYIVVFHPNGEDFTRYELSLYRLDMKEYSFIVDGEAYQSGIAEELSHLDAPSTNPQKAGYDFVGWTVNGEILSFPYQVENCVEFLASFTPIEYEIKYELNGGTLGESPSKYTVEEAISLLNPTRDFYEFCGWYESEKFEDKAVTNIEIGTYGDKTFYAKWLPIEYNIYYKLNGGTNNAENPDNYNTETSIELKAPTKDGYTFEGWFTDEDFKNQSSVIPVGEGDAKTFYAKWTANENTIVFIANGGTGLMQNMTIATNDSANLTVNAFTNDGYTFMGWSSTENGEVEYADGATFAMGPEITYTLYAVWQVNINAVIFNANGGNGTMSDYKLATGATGTLPNNIFTRDGYTFKGWSTSANGSIAYGDGASYTMGTESTYVLYALWEVIPVIDKGYVFHEEDAYVKIIGYDGDKETIEIPSYYLGKPITTIGYRAFYDNKNIKRVIVSDTVTNIEFNAFQNCSELTYVSFGKGLEVIGEKAFYNCNNLETVLFGEGLKTIGEKAFGKCSSIEYLSIPENVVCIEDMAFYNCSSMKYIYIPKSVKTIGEYAFWNCIKLVIGCENDARGSGWNRDWNESNCYVLWGVQNDSIYNKTETGLVYHGEDEISIYAYIGRDSFLSIPKFIDGRRVVLIENSAFLNCYELVSIEIPDSIIKIQMDAFSGCTSLTRVNYLGDVASWCNISFGSSNSNPLYYAKELYCNGECVTELTTLNCVTSIGSYAFSGCTSLTSVEIGDAVTSIGEYAFYKCTSLTSVVIGDAVTSIGNNAFYKCTSLASVEMGDSVTSIGKSAFDNCTSLTSIEIGDSVTTIGSYAFYGCTKLTIYCETSSELAGWHRSWNPSYCTVKWNYTKK